MDRTRIRCIDTPQHKLFLHDRHIKYIRAVYTCMQHIIIAYIYEYSAYVLQKQVTQNACVLHGQHI